ncbi:MAG: class I SAM-dependent methyltransferase [Bryobacteraceae bacterium]|jgi:2-polyprenyl-3-methyl-5-hydroxy-6-metoxy-1,4-benzoquinol methylase
MKRKTERFAPAGLDQLILRWPRIGLTDIFRANVARRGISGKLYVLLFGTPHVGAFMNGIYLRRVASRFAFSSVLDAGCGNGTFAFYMARRFPDSRVTGVDVGEQGLHTSESTLEVCARIQQVLRLPNLEFRKLDLRDLDEREAFDFVYSFDVLEHIAENRRVLENIYRSLMRNGMLLVRIPTRVQKRILSERFTASHERWAAIEHVGQHYEMDSLVADLKSIGFQIVSAEYSMGFWGRLSFELSEALQYYRVPGPIRFALVPVLKLLRLIDTKTTTGDGDGLLVLCRK